MAKTDFGPQMDRFSKVLEQRIIFHGDAYAKKAADLVLRESQKLVPVGTGHLKSTGQVEKVKVGEENAIGGVGGDYTNVGKANAYIVSYNTLRAIKFNKSTGKWQHSITKAEGREEVNRVVYSSNRSRRISVRQAAEHSLNAKKEGKDAPFNYAIIVHEGDGTREGTKFLERAYQIAKPRIIAMQREVMDGVAGDASFTYKRNYDPNT